MVQMVEAKQDGPNGLWKQGDILIVENNKVVAVGKGQCAIEISPTSIRTAEFVYPNHLANLET